MKFNRVLCVRDNPDFFEVFCVVRVVNKFDFRIVINETPNNSGQWKECLAMSRSVMFLAGSAYFLPTVVTSIKETYYLCTSVLERREYSPLPSHRTLLPGNKGNCLLDEKLTILHAQIICV